MRGIYSQALGGWQNLVARRMVGLNTANDKL
jgi:hypothetical protein